MSRIILPVVLLAALCMGSMAQQRIPVKLITGSDEQLVYLLGWEEGQVWYALRGAQGRFGVKPKDIKEIVFPIQIDDEEVTTLRRARQYDPAIELLQEGLKQFQSFRNLPSNMTQYQAALMELAYKNGNYEKSLEYSRLLADPSRDPDWHPKSDPETEREGFVFQGLALMELNRLDDAQKLFEQRGWTKDLPDEAPAEDLFITAKFLAKKQDYENAMLLAAKVVAFNSQDAEWLRPAELLCAELYAELGMYESAREVVREIEVLYKNTDEYDAAQALKLRISDLERANRSENDSE